MNASASLLDREVEVQSEIRKVRTFSRIARVPCAAIFGFSLVGSVCMLLFGVLTEILPRLNSVDGFTLQQKLWAYPVMGAMIAVWLGVIYQLYRLFGNLATGAIYTSENVRRVRRVGLLWLLLAVIGILIPVMANALTAFGIAVPIKGAFVFQWSESLSSLASAGLVLLASWIMDVGLYEKDHADALRRDADLVI